jgi:aminotransferase
MTRVELLAVAEFVERHDLFVLSDEIYDRLTYGVEHTCVPSLPGMRERTVLLGGFSKAYAMTGWRAGYVAAPPGLTEAMMKVHQYIMMSAPTVSQYAALEALRSGEEDVRGMVAEYDRRRRLIVDGFRRIGLPCSEPRGAFYAFPDVRGTGLDEQTFAERLLYEERVAVVPGSAFGPGGAGYVRACYATAYEQIEEALTRIDRFVRRLRAEAA